MGSKVRIPGGVGSRPPLFQTRHDCRGLAKKMPGVPQKKSTRNTLASTRSLKVSLGVTLQRSKHLFSHIVSLTRQQGYVEGWRGAAGDGLSKQGSKCRPASPILSCSLRDLEHEVKLKALKL